MMKISIFLEWSVVFVAKSDTASFHLYHVSRHPQKDYVAINLLPE